MVTVPQYSMREVRPRPDMQQGVDVRVSPDAFGAQIGQVMQSIGQGLGQAADAMAQLRDFEDRLKSKDALTGFERDVIDLQYGQNGYLTTQGSDAVQRQEQYARDLEALKKKYGANLSGNAARYFDDAATSAVTSGLRTGVMHAAQGRKDWAASSSTARLSIYQDQALAGYADPKAVDRALAGGFMEIDAQADLMGWDKDVVTVKRQEFATGVYSSVALAMASKPGGAGKALEYLKGKADLIDPATRMEMEAKLKPYADDEAAQAVVDQIMGTGRGASSGAAEGTVGASGPSQVRAKLYARAGAAGKGNDHVDGLNEAFATNLLAMFEDAPPGIREGLQIGSGYRSEQRQAELFDEAVKKYGSPEAARKWVAPPGNSQHNHGNAVDIWYNGVRLDQAPKEVRDWVHQNAAAYGLRFPMSWESWHIEPAGARGGGPGSTAVATTDGVTFRAQSASYDDAIAKINQIADPAVRASAMKMLTAQMELRSKAEAAASQSAKADMWAMVAQGVPVSQIPLDMKIAAGREAVQGFMDYEAKAGEVVTDPVLHRDLTLFAATNPTEFARVDLTAPEVINGLSKTDLKALIEKQGSVLSDERKAREEGTNIGQAMDWAKTQLEAVGITTANLTGAGNASKRQEMAAREAKFQMALLDEIEAWRKSNNGKMPSQVDVMQMTNKLLLPVVLNVPGSGTFSDDTKGFLFDAIDAPSNATADIVVEINDIPRDLRDAIRRDLMLERGGLPVSDEEVVQRYEDLQMGRDVPAPVNPVNFGGVSSTPLPKPDALMQMLTDFVNNAAAGNPSSMTQNAFTGRSAPNVSSAAPSLSAPSAVAPSSGVSAAPNAPFVAPAQPSPLATPPSSGAAPAPEARPEVSPQGLSPVPSANTAPVVPSMGEAAPGGMTAPSMGSPAAASDMPAPDTSVPGGEFASIISRAESILGSQSPEIQAIRRIQNGSELDARDAYDAATQVIRAITNLPKTQTRDDLLVELYAIRDRMR